MEFRSFLSLPVNRMSRVFAGFLLFAGLATIAGANSVSLFFAPGYGTTSGADPIPSEGFTFEMGTFASGFQPTYENRASWHEYWITEDPASGVEVGLVQASSSWWSDAPFLYPEDDSFGAVGFDTWVRPNGGVSAGDSIYVWGYNSKDLSGVAEWILVSNTDWAFPAPTSWGELVLPNYYPSTTEVGTTAIVGSINHSDYPDDALARQLQTASVGAVQGSLSGGDSQLESGTFYTTDSGTFTTSSGSTSGGDDFGTMESGSGDAFPYTDCLALDHLFLPTYEEWRSHFNIAAGRETVSETGDGVANYLKFALGLDPAGGRFCLPHPVLEPHPETGDLHLALRFTRPQWVENVGYTIGSSADLSAWSQDALPPVVAEPIPDTNYETVLLYDRTPAAPASRRFLRLAPEPSNGIRISAQCEADEGILVEGDIAEWLSQTDVDYVDSLRIERSDSPEGNFSTIRTLPSSSLDAENRFQFFDETVDQDKTFYYRMKVVYVYGSTIDESPFSNVAYVHATCPVPGGPKLQASCRSDRIVLKWLATEWAISRSDVTFGQWTLMRARADDPDRDYVSIPLGWEYESLEGGLFVDRTVTPDTDYYYKAYYTYQVDGDPRTSPETVIEARTCTPTANTGPVDVAFVWDNTNSLKDALDTLKADPDLIDVFLDGIADSSGGDYRLALVNTDTNIVNVRMPFALGNRDSFKTALQNLDSVTGVGYPESTDECLNTVVNGLWACHRDPTQNEEQIEDFSPPFGRYLPVGEEEIGAEREALKVVVLLTDDLPGGFGDAFTPETKDNAESYAKMARCKDIRIAAIMAGVNDKATVPFMLDYAAITGGWYSHLNSAGDGLEEAILSFIYDDEDLPAYSTPMPHCEEFPPTPPCSP